MIATMAEFADFLADIQAQMKIEVRCAFTPELSARICDAALVEALITGLPMAQGVKHRIIRSRGRGAVLTAKVHYRDGVRMLRGEELSKDEAAALETVRTIAETFNHPDEEICFERIYEWVCRNIRYAHTAPGQKGYERLVGASGVLQDRQANCQGFADVMYLLCGLCGIACGYRSGRGEKQLHVWNSVCIGDQWREVDASKGARAQKI